MFTHFDELIFQMGGKKPPTTEIFCEFHHPKDDVSRSSELSFFEWILLVDLKVAIGDERKEQVFLTGDNFL